MQSGHDQPIGEVLLSADFEEALLLVFTLHGSVVRIPGVKDEKEPTLNEALSFNPGALFLLRLVCRGFKKTIDENRDRLGLKWANEAMKIDRELLESHSPYYRISDLDFNGVKVVTDELMRVYPLTENHIIGIGNSPTIITTYIQILNPNVSITSLPLGLVTTNLAPKVEGTIATTPTTNVPMGSIPVATNSKNDWEDNKENFIKYFDSFLTNATKEFFQHNKDLVIIDYVSSGTSIRTGRDHIVRYLCEKLVAPRINDFLITTFNDRPRNDKNTIIIFAANMMGMGTDDVVFTDYLDANDKLILNEQSKYILKYSAEILEDIYRKKLEELKITKVEYDNITARVKIFSLLAPASFGIDFRYKMSLAATAPNCEFLPDSANQKIELSGTPALDNLATQLASKNLKNNFNQTLFKSKGYPEIMDGDSKVQPTFADQLRSTVGLHLHEKKNRRKL